jgi:hypothetical protein
MTDLGKLTVNDFNVLFTRRFAGLPDHFERQVLVVGPRGIAYTVLVNNASGSLAYTSPAGAKVVIGFGSGSIHFTVDGHQVGGLTLAAPRPLKDLAQIDQRLLDIALEVYAAVLAHADATVADSEADRKRLIARI